jgi:hypothetical protein
VRPESRKLVIERSQNDTIHALRPVERNARNLANEKAIFRSFERYEYPVALKFVPPTSGRHL